MKASKRIAVAKWLDEYVGKWCLAFLSRFRRRRRIRPRNIERILVIKFWGIGSIILMEPALRHLRRQFPEARIEFLTLAQNRELFELIDHVDELHTLEFRTFFEFIAESLQRMVKLRSFRFDLVIEAEFFANYSAVFAAMLRPALIKGFARPDGAKQHLLDSAIPFDGTLHAADNFLRLVGAERSPGRDSAGMSVKPVLNVIPPAAVSATAEIVINVNASALALERRWPGERFALLSRWLIRTYGARLLFIGARAEAGYTQHLIDMIDCHDMTGNLAGKLTLSELAALTASAALFISNDSGPLHLAAALDRPVIGFYGPESPARFGPLCERKLVFYSGLACSPCMSVENAKTVNCRNQLQCMYQLTVPYVIARTGAFIREHCPKLVERVASDSIEPEESMGLMAAAPIGAATTAGELLSLSRP